MDRRLSIEELALVNVLRRPGCPLTVKSADGKMIYEEGRDFEPVIDPKLGHVPWEGEYEFEHAGPTIKTTARSRIKNGDSLRVSWYHPVITHGSQIMCCLSEPKLEKILVDQARRLNALFHPKTFFMSHDEIRVANWCMACQNRSKPPVSFWPRTHGDARRFSRRSTPQAGLWSGPTCSIPTIMPSTNTIWSTAR